MNTRQAIIILMLPTENPEHREMNNLLKFTPDIIKIFATQDVTKYFAIHPMFIEILFLLFALQSKISVCYQLEYCLRI